MAASAGSARARARRNRSARGAGVAVAALLAAGCSDGRAALRSPGAGALGVPPDGGAAAACEEGEILPCHVALGVNAGILSCFVGSAVCHDGALGPCVDGSVSSLPAPDADPAAPSLLAASLPGACASNPCDPYCRSFVDAPDGGLAPPASLGGSYLGGSLSTLAPGFQNKGLKDKKHPPFFMPCTWPSDCQFDTHCVAGECVPWGAGETDASCAGVDLTVGPTCAGTVPVCNRGRSTAPAGVQVLVLSGNSAQMQDDLGLCSGYQGAVAATCATTESIPPGGCVDVRGCPLGGTQSIVVNPPSPPAPVVPISECQCGNDWSVYQIGGSCQSLGAPILAETTFTEPYEAACPEGTRVQWGYLAYQAATPSDASGASSISIHVRTATAPATLSTVDLPGVLLAAVPASAPASCPMGGPSPCPRDVFAGLGGLPRANDEQLELVFTLTPTPSGALGPVVSSWELTFSCPPSQ
jgi:hypothetical protein